MMTKNDSDLMHLHDGSTRLWTVITVIDGRISCSIHPSEYHAYREAVSRFEYAEPAAKNNNRILQTILEAATICGDYQPVRKYIEANASKLCLMQLAEHDISNFVDRRVEDSMIFHKCLDTRHAEYCDEA
jgi:hypothetical protein